jgi:hypothetical protein
MPIETFLDELKSNARATGDRWLMVQVNSLIDDICLEHGLCRECFIKPTEALYTNYIETSCDCGSKIEKYA